MLKFTILDPRATEETLGFLPQLLSPHDPRSAAKQLDHNYAHGGGWSPLNGFTMNPDHSIEYPGDPVYRPLAEAKLEDELLVFYDYQWLAIIQPDGSFEVSRMD